MCEGERDKNRPSSSSARRHTLLLADFHSQNKKQHLSELDQPLIMGSEKLRGNHGNCDHNTEKSVSSVGGWVGGGTIWC